MRILHVIPFLSIKDGGPSIAVRKMATSVYRLHGVEVEVIATDAEGKGRMQVPLETPIVEEGVTYRYFPRQSTFYTLSLPMSAWLSKNMTRFDVVHIHGLFSYANTIAAWHAHRAKVPYIVRPFGVLHTWGLTHRRPLLKQLSLRFVENPILEHAALVQYTSRAEQEESEAIGIKTPALVAPLGIEYETNHQPADLAAYFYSAFPTVKGVPSILYLSRLHPKKGLDLLLPAFTSVLSKFPHTKLILAGDGDAEFVATLRAQIQQAGIVDNVVWAGFLEGKMKAAAFATATLFALPSYSENFGIAVVEALAAGTPVIISDQVAIHDEITAADAGTVVPCNVNALAEGIITLLQNPEQRARQSANGKELVAKRFSIQAMADTLYDTYRRIAKHPSA